MAKKKSTSNQEKPVSHQEKSMEAPTPTAMENQSETVNNLKSLNDILLKETLERRGQIDSLMKSKQDLELEIERLKKQGFVDLSIEAEIRKSVTVDFVNEQVELEKERLKEEMCREKDELKRLLEEKSSEIESVGRDFERFRGEVGKEIELKRDEVDRLRSKVVDLEKRSVEAGKEIERIRLEKDEVGRVRSELEKRIEDLNREMKDVVKQKGEIQEQNGEKDEKILKLQKSLEGLTDELGRVKGTLAGVVSEKEEIQKNLDGQLEKAERLQVQVNELKNCIVGTEEELGKLRSERCRVMDEKKVVEGKLELVVKEKALVEENLLQSSKLVANLKEDIKNISIKKEEGERERTKLSAKIANSTKDVEELQTSVLALQGKEAGLLGKVNVMGERNAEALQKQEQLQLEINKLKGEKSDIEKKIEVLVGENGEKDEKIQKLQKSLQGLTDELDSVKGTLAGVVSEKEKIQKNLDGQVEKAERLQVQVNELETCNVATEEELGKLRSERRRVFDEKKVVEGKLELVVKEKAFVEENLLESSKLVANLEGEIKNISIKKGEGERESVKLSAKIASFMKEVEELKTSVLALQGKESGLLGEVNLLGERNAEALQKQEQLQLEINTLKVEKSDIEKKIEVLVDENSSTLRNLQDNVLLLEAEKQKVNEIIHEKSDIEKVKNDQLAEIDDLSEQLNTLKALVSSLEESCQKQADTNIAIQSEVTQCKDALENVTVERDNMKMKIVLKTKEEERLGLEILESESRNRVTKEELESVKILQLKLSEEIKAMKSCFDTLTGEKGELERKLVKAEGGVSELEAKMKSSQMLSVKALEMLRNTMKQLEEAGAENNEELTINGDFIAEELLPFVAELEAIRKSFKGKTGKVEEMSKRFETLKVSVSDAQKKRNFWAWLSSATTLLAAVSMAYIARGRNPPITDAQHKPTFEKAVIKQKMPNTSLHLKRQ